MNSVEHQDKNHGRTVTGQPNGSFSFDAHANRPTAAVNERAFKTSVAVPEKWSSGFPRLGAPSLPPSPPSFLPSSSGYPSSSGRPPRPIRARRSPLIFSYRAHHNGGERPAERGADRRRAATAAATAAAAGGAGAARGGGGGGLWLVGRREI